MAKGKSKYAITIEVDFYGDQENVVVKKGGKVYIYPVEDNPNLFDHLRTKLEGEKGVKIKDKREHEQARLTVYSQMETYTMEEYKGDTWSFRWY